MSMMKCPECGKDFSDRAAACPNCGYPVPKKTVSVHIERNSTIALAVNCYVYIDGMMLKELKPKQSVDCQLPVGTHSVMVCSDVRAFGHSSADTHSSTGEQFTIKDDTRSVSITIKTKGSWTGGVGKCVVDTINVR